VLTEPRTPEVQAAFLMELGQKRAARVLNVEETATSLGREV